MGLKEERDQFARAQPRWYGAIRSQIRTGDVLLFRGESPLSRFIRWGSKSVYSHAAMAAWWGPRLVLFQAVGQGVQVVPISAEVDEYDGQVDWFTLAPKYEAMLDREKVVDFAITELAKPYGHAAVVELIVRMAFHQFRGTTDPKAHPSSLFCSEYVSRCYREAGLKLRPDEADAFTSPGDLATSGYLAIQGVLHRSPVDAPRPGDRSPTPPQRPRTLESTPGSVSDSVS
jgi:hypothetical protein